MRAGGGGGGCTRDLAYHSINTADGASLGSGDGARRIFAEPGGRGKG